MLFRAGTSGFSYDEWKGGFYPVDLSSRRMLEYYSGRLPAVEINNTFYRMPKLSLLEGWSRQVIDDFRFVLKAPRRITHVLKLQNASGLVSDLFQVAASLKQKLGPVLFQLPPFLRKDLPLLSEFLSSLPEGARAAFEFRHPSWFDDDAYQVLAEHQAALCGGDVDDDAKSPPLVATATFGYLRLRRTDYSDSQIQSWAERIRAQPWTEGYAFFKHETAGPALAEKLNALLGKPGE
ncbi:MAG TPA: DUF72 domain-containing protein [Polyangiaceae bacterium]|jgi:uncharacterized protein YecE (DUF72 family)